MGWILEKRQDYKRQDNHLGVLRAWKLFGLMPSMLLRTTQHKGSEGRRILEQRFDDFQKGNWTFLIEQSEQEVVSKRSVQNKSKDDESKRRGQSAQQFVQMGEVSRARQSLVAAKLAPGNDETLEQLRKKTC